jgi:hypothetical protein
VPPAFDAVRATFGVPGEAGIPWILLIPSKERPAGNPLAPNVIGIVPVAVIVYEKLSPTVADAVNGLVICGAIGAPDVV